MPLHLTAQLKGAGSGEASYGRNTMKPCSLLAMTRRSWAKPSIAVTNISAMGIRSIVWFLSLVKHTSRSGAPLSNARCLARAQPLTSRCGPTQNNQRPAIGVCQGRIETFNLSTRPSRSLTGPYAFFRGLIPATPVKLIQPPYQQASMSWPKPPKSDVYNA